MEKKKIPDEARLLSSWVMTLANRLQYHKFLNRSEAFRKAHLTLKLLMALGEGAKIQILSPIVRGKKGTQKKELERAVKDGVPEEYIMTYADPENSVIKMMTLRRQYQMNVNTNSRNDQKK